MNERALIITTPIYYVNDVPHIGHAYTTIAADTLARHHRARGRRVFFLTGTDEHGQKVQEAAGKRGLTPKEHCDRTVSRFADTWKRLDISNDAFIRTTDTEHIAYVSQSLARLKADDEIYSAEYSGWYSVAEERFITETEKESGHFRDLRQLTETNYFFRMGRRQAELVKAIESGRIAVLPDARRNEVLGFLRTQKLDDLCISRPVSRLTWGVPMPFDPGFVTYVWFDALLNYVSATLNNPRLTGAAAPEWKDAEITHIIGKDILTTHSVYWPTFLMALGLSLPTRIVAHGWWTVNGEKMSKSVGNVVDPIDMVDRYGSDAFRYFLLRDVPFGQDGDFSETALAHRINADLANDFGNLVGRLTTLIGKEPGSRVTVDAAALEHELTRACREDFDRAAGMIESLNFSGALTTLFAAFARLNKHINDERPWEAQGAARGVILARVFVNLARGVCIAAPVLTVACAEAARRLGISPYLSNISPLFDNAQLAGRTFDVTCGAPLIKRHEAAVTVAAKPAPAQEIKGGKPMIEIDDFQKLELKTGKVLEAEKVEGADRLLRVKISTGGEERTVVAGIATSYDPAALIGKTVVILCNLKPRKLRGIESHGMLLAAGEKDQVRLLTVDGDVPAGSEIR